MSMIMQYVRIRDHELARLRDLIISDPNDAYDYVDELADASDESVAPERSRGMDTDKTWDAMAFLLARVGAPVDVIHGGSVLTTDEWGYEPPRYLAPADVGVAAEFLRGLPFERLREHFDPTEMRNIYPTIWAQEDSIHYLRHWYEPLTKFFTEAAAENDGIIIYLS